ncbi:MAG TPA: phenylalanine--tRNA ligase subunit alpha [Candidatus Acidoferrum sp.]|nr:phenylalanine--tRNA ligase subunit alpha [Candidatus Acidoferrum sp.]
MHEYEAKLLGFLSKSGSASLDQIVSGTGLGRDAVMWAAESLSKRGALQISKGTSSTVEVREEGKRYSKEFPEESLVKKLKAGKEKISNIKDQIALGWAKKNGWISIDKGTVSLTEEGKRAASGSVEYPQREALAGLISGIDYDKILKKYKDVAGILAKRGLIELKERSGMSSISITTVGKSLLSKEAADRGTGMLTKEMIKSGDWKRKPLRPYDVNAPTEPSYPARAHPIREFINVMRNRWLEMGFIEVAGPIIETAFWNFDVLFSPQDHPTREMQDTFFLSNPKELTIEDIETLNNVREMHLTGWKESWSEQIAKAAVLRTHTTSVSARYMKKLAQAMQSNYPVKMFSIGPVFRNESVDYKHLAELRQYDGIIVGDNLTLANLIYTLKSFYAKLGLEEVGMRPSYFPFTEPSVEFFYYDKEHDQTVELCGGGIIRKEITKAVGLNKTVLAWGGGLDRLMLHEKIFGVENLPTLYKNEISWLRTRKNLKV